MMARRRWLLPSLVAMIVVPLIAVLAFSGYGIYAQQRAMVKAAKDFAQTLAQNLAGEPVIENMPIHTRSSGQRVSVYLRRTRTLKMLQSGPPVHGWVAMFDANGRLTQGSGGSREMPEITKAVKAALLTHTVQTSTVSIGRNPPSALAVAPCPDGRHAAVAVISHYLVPPNMRFTINAMSYHGYSTIAVLAIAVLGVFLLLRYCIWPLRSLAAQVGELKWGYDTLTVEKYEPLPELSQMQDALSDLSERAVDREQLKKNYVEDIVRTQEEERKRIARDIHDTALQTVSSTVQRIQLALRAMSKETPDLGRISSHLSLAQEAGKTAVQELRDACDKLAPPWLSLGAFRALEEFALRLSRTHGIDVSVTSAGDDKGLDEDRVQELCRIVQESAANAANHGHASKVDVSLDCEGDCYVLTVHDNGSGISGNLDPELLRVQGHRGLAGMKERAGYIGGSFSIGNAPEGGTLITVTIPKSSSR